jgi:hypothetical protein
MTAREVKDWQERLRLTRPDAARAIGVSLRMFDYYASGEYPVPRTVELAMRQVEAERAA